MVIRDRNPRIRRRRRVRSPDRAAGAGLSRLPVLFGCLIGCVAVVAAGEVAKQNRIKAAFLINFAKFTDWPDAAFSNDTAPLVIAVVGKNPFGRYLQNASSNQKIAGRRLEVRTVEGINSPNERMTLDSCHVAYVCEPLEDRIAPLLRKLDGRPILTVSDITGFCAQGGMIELVIVNRRIRFDVNVGSARTSGLRLSSKLLKLARKVIRKQETEP